jgi:hypothetical protein
MATKEYISPLAEAQLAFDAAAQRLGKSRRNLNDFLTEHANRTPSPELQSAFEREQSLLECEVDAAFRHFKKAASDLEEAKARGDRHAAI